MNIRASGLLGVLLLGVLVSGDQAGAQTIWRCGDIDAPAVFTDRPGKNCRVYQPHVRSLVIPQRRDQEVKLTVEASPAPGAPVAGARAGESREQGLISFSTMNRLSVGMTEAEVMNLAGPPKTRNLGSWVYALGDDAIVELRFGTGRVVEIRQYKPTP